MVKGSIQISGMLFLLCLLVSCKKDKDVLGVEVQPSNDALGASFSQTEPVFAYTMKYDSILSWNSRYQYLGINNDPYFGVTQIGLYLLPNIPDGKTEVSFGDDAVLSSAEIILAAYNTGVSHVGSPDAQVTYSVYPLSVLPDASETYYTGYDRLHNTGSLLGVYTGTYGIIDDTPVLRIPIDNNFAKAILNNPQYLVDNETFQNNYRGFYIKSSVAGGDGLIAQIDLEDELSGFYLYYQNGTPSATKTDKSFRFTFGGSGTNALRYNTVKHSFATASSGLQQQVLNNDTAKGADNLFLKGMGISKVRLYIPSLKNYSDSFPVAVNRAELVLKVDPAFDPTTDYAPPSSLCLLPADSIGREMFALDQVNSTDAARYDGTYDSDTKSYTFNIARHVQAILSGKQKNYGFYVVVGDASSLSSYSRVYDSPVKELYLLRRDNFIERVVLAGSNHPTLKPVFNLSYVKLLND